MSERHLRCREVVELLNDYLDGTLAALAREEVERHLATCNGCIAFLQQLRATVRVAATLTEDDVPAPVMAELLRAFRNAG